MSTSSPVSELAVSETGFVFDPRTGATFSVNQTGLVVLTALRGQSGPGDIAEALRERFEGTPSDVREHVEDFLHALRQLGVSVTAPAKAGAPATVGGEK
jgi:PqqD family protein of HPr-rel-A system